MQLAQPRKKSLVNLTPLIDVVFILLIFFMLASNFIRWHYIELAVGDVGEIEVDHNAISIIRIEHNQSHYLNDKKLSLNIIINEIRKKVRKNLDHPIVIKPEQGTKAQAMVDVLNLLQNFAGSNISIAKPEKDQL